MKLLRENFKRETALVQLGLTRIYKSPLNLINFTLLTAGISFGLVLVKETPFGTKGIFALGALTVCNMTFIFLFTFAYSCRVISEEKQYKTMILLRLTPVSEKNIFWGKILPPFLNLFQMLVFQLPFMILAFTLGGVTLSQVIKVYTLIIFTSASLSAMSAWVSAGNPENWLSHFNYIFIFFGLCTLYGLMQLFRLDPNTGFIPQLIDQANPVSCSFYVISTPNQSLLPAILASTLFILLCLKLGYRSFIVNIDFDEIIPEAPKMSQAKRSIDFSKFPIAQKEFHFGTGGRKSQLIIAVALTILGTMLFFMFRADWHPYSSGPTPLTQVVLVNLCVLTLLVVYYSGNSMQKEKIDRTWNDLIICPFEPGQIIKQKIWGAVKHVAPMVIILLIILIINMPQTVKDIKYIYFRYRFAFVLPPFTIFMLMAYTFLQIFEKSPSSITLYLLLSLIGIVAIFDQFLKEMNGALFIGICSTIFLFFAYIFYRYSVKIIEQSSQQ